MSKPPIFLALFVLLFRQQSKNNALPAPDTTNLCQSNETLGSPESGEIGKLRNSPRICESLIKS